MGKFYGYCRVSTDSQNIDRQIRNIKEVCPDAEIVQEAFTGTTLERKQWIKLYNKVKKGDTIIFDSVSRMSRNAEEGFKCYQDLYNKGVNLVFLKESYINTDTYKKAVQGGIKMTGGTVDIILDAVNKYLMELAKEQIRLAFEQAEKEVTDLRKRTSEGIETARLNGKRIGRPKGSTGETEKSKKAKEIIKKKAKAFGGLYPDDDVIKILGISRNTYYKYKSELKVDEYIRKNVSNE